MPGSLGRWWAGRRWSRSWPTWEARSQAWGLRLVQIQISTVYLSTAWIKWHGSTWRDGTALYYVSRMEDLFGRFWLPETWFETAWMVKTGTWGVLGLETLLPFMLWFRPTRRLALGLAFGLHLGIEYAMHLFLFEWIMMVGLLSFIKPEEWSWVVPGDGRVPRCVSLGRAAERGAANATRKPASGDVQAQAVVRCEGRLVGSCTSAMVGVSSKLLGVPTTRSICSRIHRPWPVALWLFDCPNQFCQFALSH